MAVVKESGRVAFFWIAVCGRLKRKKISAVMFNK